MNMTLLKIHQTSKCFRLYFKISQTERHNYSIFLPLHVVVLEWSPINIRCLILETILFARLVESVAVVLIIDTLNSEREIPPICAIGVAYNPDILLTSIIETCRANHIK